MQFDCTVTHLGVQWSVELDYTLQEWEKDTIDVCDVLEITTYDSQTDITELLADSVFEGITRMAEEQLEFWLRYGHQYEDNTEEAH